MDEVSLGALLPKNKYQGAIGTCNRKSASNDNTNQKETARDNTAERKEISQGFCFNTAHGCPLPQLVPQADVCSTAVVSHHQLLKDPHMGEDEHCLAREDGGQRTSLVENQVEGRGGFIKQEEPGLVAKSKEKPIEKQGFWWWTALSSSQMKTCPWKTLLQSFLVEVEQVLRRYRLKVEQEEEGGKQAWLGRACSRRSGGGGWWNSCGVIIS